METPVQPRMAGRCRTFGISPLTWAGRKHDLQMKSVPITPESLKSYDCVLVSTNHTAFDWAMIAKHSRLVVDSRDALRPFHREMEGRIVLA